MQERKQIHVNLWNNCLGECRLALFAEHRQPAKKERKKHLFPKLQNYFEKGLLVTKSKHCFQSIALGMSVYTSRL